MRDELKAKSTLIKSLIAPYTLAIEYKKHKTKKLKNESTIDKKNSINSKQTSKANNNMASKTFPVIDSIDFHINKLVPENGTAESKNHIRLPFPYEGEDLPIQEIVGGTTTPTINSTNNANTNNNTLNNNNSIFLLSSTTITVTNNRTGNKNTNNNAVNGSNKLLTAASASNTKTNNTNSVNAKNSENNTSSKLMPSSIDEERNESEKCDIAAKQGVKEKIPVLNSEQWKKGTRLIARDSMLAGLREAKLSRNKRIKVGYFPGGKAEDLRYHLIRYLKKEPDNIIIHIGTNNSLNKMEDFIYKELVNVRETIIKFHRTAKKMAYHHLLFKQIRRKRITYLKNTATF